MFWVQSLGSSSKSTKEGPWSASQDPQTYLRNLPMVYFMVLKDMLQSEHNKKLDQNRQGEARTSIWRNW